MTKTRAGCWVFGTRFSLWDDAKSRLLIAAILVYGVASLADLISAIMDLIGDATFVGSMVARVSFVVSGGLSVMVWVPQRQWLSAISAGFFMAGAIVYLVTDCLVCDAVFNFNIFV